MVLVVVGLIGLLLVGLVVWAWSERPIVEYGMFGHWHGFDSKLSEIPGMTLPLKIRNIGNSHAKLNVILEAVNANIIWISDEPFLGNNGTRLVINCDLPNGMSSYRMWEVNITIPDPAHIQSFELYLTVQNLADWSLPDGFISHFLEANGTQDRLRYHRTPAPLMYIYSEG
jgi:hypothetical protein